MSNTVSSKPTKKVFTLPANFKLENGVLVMLKYPERILTVSSNGVAEVVESK